MADFSVSGPAYSGGVPPFKASCSGGGASEAQGEPFAQCEMLGSNNSYHAVAAKLQPTLVTGTGMANLSVSYMYFADSTG